MAQQEDFSIDKGSDVTIELYLINKNGSAKNLGGHTVAAKMKKTYTTSDSDATVFTTAIMSPATRGVTTLSLTNTQTNALTAGRYVYDVEVSYTDSDGDTIIERVLEGKINVTPNVT